MQFWLLNPSLSHFLFDFKEVSHSIWRHTITCMIFAKLTRKASLNAIGCPKFHLRALAPSIERYLFLLLPKQLHFPLEHRRYATDR